MSKKIKKWLYIVIAVSITIVVPCLYVAKLVNKGIISWLYYFNGSFLFWIQIVVLILLLAFKKIEEIVHAKAKFKLCEYTFIILAAVLIGGFSIKNNKMASPQKVIVAGHPYTYELFWASHSNANEVLALGFSADLMKNRVDNEKILNGQKAEYMVTCDGSWQKIKKVKVLYKNSKGEKKSGNKKDFILLQLRQHTSSKAKWMLLDYNKSNEKYDVLINTDYKHKVFQRLGSRSNSKEKLKPLSYFKISYGESLICEGLKLFQVNGKYNCKYYPGSYKDYLSLESYVATGRRSPFGIKVPNKDYFKEIVIDSKPYAFDVSDGK